MEQGVKHCAEIQAIRRELAAEREKTASEQAGTINALKDANDKMSFRESRNFEMASLQQQQQLQYHYGHYQAQQHHFF